MSLPNLRSLGIALPAVVAGILLAQTRFHPLVIGYRIVLAGVAALVTLALLRGAVRDERIRC